MSTCLIGLESNWISSEYQINGTVGFVKCPPRAGKSYEQKRYGADNWCVLVNMVFKEQFHF